MSRLIAILVIGMIMPGTAFAQRVPDPNKVSPEYREAAQKRLAEIIRQKACWAKAEKEKVARRDAASFVVHCMYDAEKAEQVEIGTKAKN